jgi:hypothetical protein
MGRELVKVLVALAVGATVSCGYDASFRDCTINCSDATGCPDGFSCSITEGLCRPAGFNMSCSSIVGIGPPDFVVNSNLAGDHYLSHDFEANGVQLAATPDGKWTAAFGAACTNCTVFGRRFDSTGVALNSVVAGGTNDFPLTTTLTTSAATPAAAASGATTNVFWNFTDTVGTGTGVACRALDELGNSTPGQLSISTDSADVVTTAPLSDGNYAVAWHISSPAAVRTIIAKPDCTPLTAQPSTASAAIAGVERPHVAANTDSVLYAWLVDGGTGADLHLRPASNTAVFGTEVTPIVHSATEGITAVRVAPLGAGFAAVVRWAAADQVSPGRIELYQVSTQGTILAGPTLIAANTGSDFVAGIQSFGVATRADGALMIVWHECANGAAGTCDVLGRIVRPTGVPVGDAFMVPTTTTGDQVNPSVVALQDGFVAAWDDSSHAPPVTDAMAVRARIVKPAYDDAVAVIGAECGGTLPPCNPGLTCAMGTDNVERCFETCTPPNCADGGTCTLANTTTYACTF